MKRRLVAYAFIGPALLHLVVFAVGPILYALLMSLHHWHLLDTE